jgi:hypothetical protein
MTDGHDQEVEADDSREVAGWCHCRNGAVRSKTDQPQISAAVCELTNSVELSTTREIPSCLDTP